MCKLLTESIFHVVEKHQKIELPSQSLNIVMKMMFCRQSNAGTSWSSQCINFQPETIEVLSLISSAICEYSAFYIKEMESKVKYIHSNLN